MRDEEGKKKEASKVKKKQGKATQHTQGSHSSYIYIVAIYSYRTLPDLCTLLLVAHRATSVDGGTGGRRGGDCLQVCRVAVLGTAGRRKPAQTGHEHLLLFLACPAQSRDGVGLAVAS